MFLMIDNNMCFQMYIEKRMHKNLCIIFFENDEMKIRKIQRFKTNKKSLINWDVSVGCLK